MDWKDNINTIKEIFPGQYQIILDFATINIVQKFLSDDYKYVWVNQHITKNHVSWQEYNLPLFENTTNQRVLARNLKFDFILPTTEFKTILPLLSNGIKLIQLNELPQHYLNPDHIKGKTWYDLLSKECNYLFEVDIPSATDYGTLVSPYKDWLQSMLDNKGIDWDNLP